MSLSISQNPNSDTPRSSHLHMTTLYDLMMMLSTRGHPQDPEASTMLGVHWINTGRIRFMREYTQHRVVCS